MNGLPIPQFCLDFLLKYKTYLKARPPSTSMAKSLCLTHYVTHYMHCLVSHNIDISNVSPPLLSLLCMVHRPWALFCETMVCL